MLENGLYNVLGGLIRLSLSTVTIPILIRLIGIEEYGLWTIASTAIGIVALAEGGLSVATTVFVSRDLNANDQNAVSQTLTVTVGSMLLLATLATFTLGVGAEAMINFFPKLSLSQRAGAIQALQVGGIVVWARLVQQILVGLEQAYQRYGVMNLLNTLQIAFSSLGMVLVAYWGGKTVALMQWQALISVATLIAHISFCWLLLRHLKLQLQWNTEKTIAIARYSCMTWVGSLGGVLFSQGDRLIIGALLGTKLLGVYAAITTITTQINIFSTLPVQPLLPAVSSLLGKKEIDQRSLRHQIKKALQINGFVALGIGAGLYTLAPVVMQILLPGSISSDYIVAFRIATIIYSLYSVNAVAYYILFGMNLVGLCTLTQLSSAVLSLGLIFINIKLLNLGLLGAVLGNGAYLAAWLLTFFAMSKLKISLSTWAGWTKFPLLWFFLVVLTNLCIQNYIGLNIIMVILESIGFNFWFFQQIREKYV